MFLPFRIGTNRGHWLRRRDVVARLERRRLIDTELGDDVGQRREHGEAPAHSGPDSGASAQKIQHYRVEPDERDPDDRVGRADRDV